MHHALRGFPIRVDFRRWKLFRESQFGGGATVDEPKQFLAVGVGAWGMRVVALREGSFDRVGLACFGCEHPRIH